MTVTSEPLVYDPYAYEIHDDPYPTYARMREEAPLYRNVERGFWALSRHADVMAAFRDSERFSNAEGVSIDPAASGPHAHKTMSFLAMDPPNHGRMRGLVARGFTPRRVAGMEDGIRALTVQHLDDCLAKGDFDFVADLAGKVPMDVISEMLGVPQADREMLRKQSDLLIHREEGVTDVPPAGVEAALARSSGLRSPQNQAWASSLVVVSLPATTMRNRNPMISSSVRRSPSTSAASSAEVRSSVGSARRWASMSA